MKSREEIFQEIKKLLDLDGCTSITAIEVHTLRKEIINLTPTAKNSVGPGAAQPSLAVSKKGRKGGNKGPQKKGVSEGKFSLHREYSTKDEDLVIIRQNFLSPWKKKGLLTENQMKALEAIGRTSNKKLTDIQKQQILDIFCAVRKQIASKG